MRSDCFSFHLFAIQHFFSVWAIPIVQAAITVGTIEIFFGNFAPHISFTQKTFVYFLLAATTPLSFFTCFVMPDYLAALVVICSYLIVFHEKSLTNLELLFLLTTMLLGLASHTTHILLSVGLLIFSFFLVYTLKRLNHPVKGRGTSLLVWVHVIFLFLQIGSNLALYGSVLAQSQRPPFLTARVVGDGTAEKYLASKDTEADQWAVSKYSHLLPQDSDTFLWGGEGVIQQSEGDDCARMVEEDFQFTVAAIKHSPIHQLSKSLINWKDQILSFDMQSFRSDFWVESNLKDREQKLYFSSRQGRRKLNLATLTKTHYVSVLASLLFMPFLLWHLISKHAGDSQNLVVFTIFVCVALLGNALITGVLSRPLGRYEARVIWLVPFAFLLLLETLLRSRSATQSA